MQKILPILLAATVYLSPLYPVYAQLPARPAPALKNASAPAALRPGVAEAIENKMERIEDRMENLKDKMASRAAALKEKLAKFKDKTKANRLENINNNLNTVNDRRTNQMREALEKIASVLERIKAKTEEAAGAGKDVAAINAAIAEAESEWMEADVAVKSQAEKDYSIVVNTESTVKTDASSARDTLKADLNMAHTQLVEARQTLANALSTALSSIKGGNNGSQ